VPKRRVFNYFCFATSLTRKGYIAYFKLNKETEDILQKNKHFSDFVDAQNIAAE